MLLMPWREESRIDTYAREIALKAKSFAGNKYRHATQ
jgi:hypothetical protein